MERNPSRERVDVVVVGGGQAGLATSHHLGRHGIAHVVLDAGDRAGATWRARWDSLRLFTPARYSGLPGLRFPAPPGSYPTKDEMADYLESYAERFRLPVRHGVRVDRLTRHGDSYLVRAGGSTVEAAHVIVAAGPLQTRAVPAFADDLDPAIRQVHAGDYRNPGQRRPGSTLVVGAGNSGVELAVEAAAAGHRTYLAGRDTGRIPPAAYAFGGRLFWFLATQVLSVRTPAGRRARPRILSGGGPLIRHSMRDVAAAGVERTPRVTAVSGGLPVVGDGRALEVANVLWCTGFGRDYGWIEVPGLVIEPGGMPRHDRGIVRGEPGLSFVGLPFQTKLASAFIGGVGGDAAYVVGHVASSLVSRPAGSPRPGAAGRDTWSAARARR
jgi:putative flavoprotein involved in K+ transport